METKLTCYGGVGSVTGANFLLEIAPRLRSGQAGKKYLVDCGLEQGSREASEHNHRTFAYNPSEITALFVTHAHIDHTGLIPKLVKEGFQGDIYSTPATREIAELLLEDVAKINREKEHPLYGAGDVAKALSLWKTIPYHQKRDFEGFSIELFDAGHVLGSSMIKFSLPNGKTLLTSGDLGNCPSPLLNDTEVVSGVDYLLMESVYGDRNHEDSSERVSKLKQIIAKAIERQGTLLIPVFSLDRTQILLYEMDNFFESGELPSVPVFLDSPLAIKITNVYEKWEKSLNADVQSELKRGDQIFNFDRLRETMQGRESYKIRETKGPKIILAGSGMSTGGRITHHEADYLPDPNTTILFVGYQAPGTLGRQIAEGVKEVIIDNKQITVRAQIEKIDGFSAHADSDTLVKFVEPNKDNLKKVFVAMGEPGASQFLAQRLRDELEVDAIVPEANKTYLLN